MLAHQPPAWVFFSDDDDIWSRRRYALYARQYAAAPADARALLCRRKACFLRRVLHIATDADSVREMLASGVLRLADSDLRDGLEEHEHNMAEYFDLAVRYDAFAQFFATMPPCVTQHKLCDLAFTFLYCRDRNTIRWIPDDDDFVYFYSRGAHAGGASNSAESVPRHELEQALQLLQEAPREVQRSFSSPQAFHGFVASMRQAIEQEMIMIRATGRVAPAQIIYAACAHEADLCLRALAIERGPGSHSAANVRWACAVARGALCESILRQFEFEALVCWRTWHVTKICTRRDTAQIFSQDCGYATRNGKREPRVGMWVGGAPPPAQISLGGAEAKEPIFLLSGESLKL